MIAATRANLRWAEGKVSTLPKQWQKRIISRYVGEACRTTKDVIHYRRFGNDYVRECEYQDGEQLGAAVAANEELNALLDRLGALRLPIVADDDDLRERAAHLASECKIAALQFCDAYMYENGEPLSGGELVKRYGVEWWKPLAADLRYFAEREGVVVPWDKRKDGRMTWGGVARMLCESFWRRNLRRNHAKVVEGAAIGLGYVNRARECYVSDESVGRRKQQNRRNKRILESVKMRNEEGQEFTLAELSAKGTADKEIRRGELMTRISGFEEIAKECGHDGLFLTMTCPSRMHRYAVSKGGKAVVENRKYDGTTPRQAQAHLSKVWARIRSALDRAGLQIYGFRIAEPNHDGTPHWHLILFMGQAQGETRRAALPRVCAIVRRYALGEGDRREQRRQVASAWKRVTPFRTQKIAKEYARKQVHLFDVAERKRQNTAERGAKQHRIDAKVIDWKRGGASAYVAKYVSKNINGNHIEGDLYGNDAVTVGVRVETWAATWGIRQFQQIGGAPVTVWRELRRVKELPDEVPEHLRAAHAAVNKTEAGEGVEAKKADFAAYVRAQGGVFVGRKYKIRLAKEDREGEGRYGEPMEARPVGVETMGVVACMVGAFMGCKVVQAVVKSARHVWEVVRGLGLRAAHAAPWTRVNNCTRKGGESGQKNDGAGFGGGGSRVRADRGDKGGDSWDWILDFGAGNANADYGFV